MSGFGFTQLMGGGGGSNIVTFGTGGDYADIGALISAGLADTYARNTDTGRLYLTDSGGYPLPSDIEDLGTPTKRLEFTGSETADGDLTALGWALTETGTGAITYEGSHIRFDCPVDGDRAGLRNTDAFGGSYTYTSGYCRVPIRDSDANGGNVIAQVIVRESSGFLRVVALSADNGSGTNENGGAANTKGQWGTPNVGSTFVWFEILQQVTSVEADGPCILYLDHRVAVTTSIVREDTGNDEVRIAAALQDCGVSRSEWKHFRHYTIA